MKRQKRGQRQAEHTAFPSMYKSNENDCTCVSAATYCKGVFKYPACTVPRRLMSSPRRARSSGPASRRFAIHLCDVAKWTHLWSRQSGALVRGRIVLPGHQRPHDVSERLDLAHEEAEGVVRHRRLDDRACEMHPDSVSSLPNPSCEKTRALDTVPPMRKPHSSV